MEGQNKLKINLTKQQVIVYGITAAVAIASLLVMVRWIPMRKEIKQLTQKKNEQKYVIEKAAAESKNLELIRKKLDSMQEECAAFDLQLPNNRDLGEFLQQISDLMDEHKLTDQQVEPGKNIKNEKLACIPVEIRCKGKMKQLFEFTKALSDLDRLIRVDSMEFSNDTNFNGDVTITAKTRIYYKT